MAKQERQEAGGQRGILAFLTPGWILTVVIVVMFTYFAFTVLAPWQLGKNSKQTDFNNRLKTAVEQEPRPIAEVLPAIGDAEERASHEWTPVSFQGHYLPHKEVLLRSRPVAAQPAYQVLTPFKTTDGLTFIVNRGWLAADSSDAVKISDISAAPSSDLTLTGYVRLGEGRSEQGVLESEGRQQITTINAEQIGQSQGLELDRDYVQLDEQGVEKTNAAIIGNGRNPQAVPLPQIESGPYLSYGIQWIAFGIIAPILFGWFVWSEVKERRRAKAEAAELAGATTPANSSVSAGERASDTEHDLMDTAVKNTADKSQLDNVEGPLTADPPRQQPQEKKTDLKARYGKSHRRRGFGFRSDDGGERF